jgi:hypothetical protein
VHPAVSEVILVLGSRAGRREELLNRMLPTGEDWRLAFDSVLGGLVALPRRECPELLE